MARPQTTNRGARAAERIDIKANQLTNNASGLRLNLGLALSGEGTDYITQNSTSVNFPSGVRFHLETAAPSGRQYPGTVYMVGNSTGNLLAINTTGTTWAYIQTTSVLA